MKKKIVAFFIGAAFTLAAFKGLQTQAHHAESATRALGEEYPQTFIVDSVDYSADVVTLRTSTGYLYQFSGVEDWAPGDMVAAIMNDNGTTEIFDDVILRTRYTGAANQY